MRPSQKINGGSRFDQEKNLRRFLNRGKIRERLLDPVVEHLKIFAPQALDEVAARIGHNHSDVDAVNAYANRLLRLFRIVLRLGESTYEEHGREKQCCQQKTKGVHRPAIRSIGPNESLWNPSTKRSMNNGDVAKKLVD